MKLFVKNLDRDINEMQLEGLFAQYGKVVDTKIVYDKITWESKGYAFIEMAKKEDGQKAIEALNGKEIRGRALEVSEAEERRRF
jgi:RNA recognition motif-containing protein